jgi:hypothetical protein
MSACLQKRHIEIDDRDLYDLRYFYVDGTSVGRYTCGVAFEAMMSIFRQNRLDQFGNDEWYSAVKRFSDNPLAQGFLAEHICLNSIATHGLTAVDKRLSRMSYTSFEETPDFEFFLSTDWRHHLYVPAACNLSHVDGAIVLLDRDTKTAQIYLLQFTLSKRHRRT